MVTAHKARKAGKVLDLLRLRAVRDDCLCLRPLPGTRARYQREYQAVVQVNPCNFTLMSAAEQEGILEGWRSFLASRSPQDGELALHIRVRTYQLAPYLERLRLGIEGQADDPGFVEMARDHVAFISHLGAEQALLRREFFVRIAHAVNVRDGKYKHLSAEEVFDQAKSELARKVREVTSGLSRASLGARRLDSEELVQYYQSCLHMRQAEEYPIARSQLYALDYPIQPVLPQTSLPPTALVPYIPSLASADLDGAEPSAEPHDPPGSGRQWVWRRASQIARARRRAEKRGNQEAPDLMSLPELVEPASVEQTASYLKVHHSVGDEYLRARAIVGYPAYVVGGWVDDLLKIDEPGTDMLLFISSLDPTAYVRSLSRSLSGYRATQMLELRHGRTEDPYISAARSEVEQLREKIVHKTEMVHAYSLYLFSRASDRQTLKERDAKLASHLKGLELHSVPLQFEHLPAWLSLVDGRDTLRRQRKADTSTLVAGFPFCSANLSTEPGVLVGLTADGPLILDPMSDALDNGHELVFAKSGAGKSYYRKVDASRQVLTGKKVIAIDNETEYEDLCQQYHGSYIRIAPGSLQLNPFDLPRLAAGDEQRQILEEKLNSLLALFDLLLAEKNPGVLSQSEKSYLNRILTQAYEAHGITANPATHTHEAPTMHEVFALITQDGDPHGMGERLLRYLSSFPSRTQVDLDTSMVIFSLIDLPKEEESALRAVALYLITEFVWAQVRQERLPVPRLLLIDEAWTLMRYPDAARFLDGISRRARKYNLALRLATQSVEDFLSSEAGRSMLHNSSMKFLMKQDSTTIGAVVRTFQLSDEERKLLLGAEKGEGLYFCDESRVPLRVVASAREHALAGTTAKERSQAEVAKAARRAAQETITQQGEREAALSLLLRTPGSHQDAQLLSPNGASGALQEKESDA